MPSQFSAIGFEVTSGEDLAALASHVADGAETITVQDRKSTRLNSSHVAISYAVFCLKKKNLVVQKYGGTSVGTAQRICKVARRLVETQREGCQVLAVVSAMPAVTDHLPKIAGEISSQ